MSAAILPTLDLAARPGPARDLWAAAAVRESFQPEALLDSWLHVHQGAPKEERRQAMRAALDLQAACITSSDEDMGPGVRLPTTHRLKALNMLGHADAHRTLSAMEPADQTPTERLFQLLLGGESIAINRDDQTQLMALSRVAPWAEAAGVKLPFDPLEMDRYLARTDFLRAVGGTDLHRFVGRDSLRRHLGRRWAGEGASQPVLIEGPGGIGKSLAVSRFIADLLESPESRPDAVFHIDFDRFSLQRARPATILQEVVRQAARWWAVGRCDELLSLARDLSSGDADLDLVSESVRSIEANRNDFHLADRLVETLRRDAAMPPRIIYFVDTFEQVETFSDSAAYSARVVADLLASAGARLLQIYASRAFAHPTTISDEPPIRLVQFSVPEAETYLRNEAARAGFDVNSALAAQVRKAVGRSPLALRLAVGILEKEESSFDPEAWSELARDDPESIQAALYDRFLRRIRSRELRKIARPGLLVRRLSAEVIAEVLAEPCELDLSKTSPNLLMEDARSEGQLFSTDASDPGALRHRQDVRRVMLAPLDASIERDLAQAINERAIAYYSTRSDDLIHRTEELYHRLRLDQSSDDLDRRWRQDAGRALRPALQEFPPAARRYLRRKLGAASLFGGAGADDPPKSIEKAAPTANDSDLWRELRQVARQQIQSGTVSPALLARLEEEGLSRLDGPLVDISFELLAWQGKHDELLDRARTLLTAPPHRVGNDILAAVHSTAAALLEGRELLSEAETFWLSALRSAELSGADELLDLSCLIGTIRIRRKLDAAPALRRVELDRAAAVVADQQHRVFERRVLAREAGAELSEVLLEPEAPSRYPILRLVSFVLDRNEAFPSAVDDLTRLQALGWQFAGRDVSSVHEVNDVVAKLIYGDANQVTAVVRALREEVDWTLRRASLRSGSGGLIRVASPSSQATAAQPSGASA